MNKKVWLVALCGCLAAAAVGLAACNKEKPQPQPEVPHEHSYPHGVCECGEQDANFTGDAVEYRLAAGGSYTGAMTAGVPDGAGVITYESGDTLAATFGAGAYTAGKYTFENGHYYEGGFADGKYSGEGKFSWSSNGADDDGWLFVGTFEAGKAKFGKTTTAGRETAGGLLWYEGAMKDLNDVDETQKGTGYFLYADSGCTYTGAMYSSGSLETAKFDGEGVFTWATADFTGTYENGVPKSGTKKIYTDATKETVSETYVGGVNSAYLYAGSGKLTMANGDVYEGEFADGFVSGEATATYANGATYVGGWQNGRYHGEGTFTFKSGMHYTGGYVNGLREGKGKFSWATNGDESTAWLFTGDFKADKAVYGKTETRNTNGIVWYEGAMNDLNDVKTSERGTGYFVYADSGCTYTGGMTATGALANIKFDGTGKFTWSASDFEGTYANGIPLNGTRKFYRDATKQEITGTYVGGVNAAYNYHGKGKFTFASGMNYEGDYVNGKREGQGAFSWSTTGNIEDGHYFEGTFVNDNPTHGKRTIVHGDKIVGANLEKGSLIWYEGDWITLDKPAQTAGTGYYHYKGNCWYKGGYTCWNTSGNFTVDGKFNGEGTFSWNEELGKGDYIVGTFANGIAVSGTRYFPGRTAGGILEYTGEFANTDSFKQGTKATGKYVTADGIYSGDFDVVGTGTANASVALTGKGTLTYKADATVTGATLGLTGDAAEWKVSAVHGEFAAGKVSGSAVYYLVDAENTPAGYVTGTYDGTTRTGAMAADFEYTLDTAFEGTTDCTPAEEDTTGQ